MICGSQMLLDLDVVMIGLLYMAYLMVAGKNLHSCQGYGPTP